MLTFNTDNMVQQEFPFPAPIMDYIYKNISAAQLLKLYKTCKFFYDKFRLNIIEDLEIDEQKYSERTVGNSMAIWHQNPAWSKMKNLWVSNSFAITDDFKNVNLDHSKFARLSFDKLKFEDNCFFVEDFQFLVKCPTLRHLIIWGKVHDMKNKRNLSLEEIIEQAPQVSTFDLTPHREAPIDMTKLIALNRQTKITSFHLHCLVGSPDPLLAIEFFKKHAVPEVDYYFGIDPDASLEFNKIVDDGLKAWKLSLALPPAISSYFIDLTGKVAVITGAAEGIGRATVILFRQLGASVIAIARNKFQLKELTEECQSIKTDGYIHTVNDDLPEIFYDRLRCKFTKIDILVHILDVSTWYCFPNPKRDDEHRDNYSFQQGHLDIISFSFWYLKEAKGTIINVSTPNELITKPGNAIDIAKFERDIKIDELKLAKSGVRTNTVSSGVSITALSRPHGMNDADYKKYLQNFKKSHDQQAANSIAFLASDSAKSIEGAVLPVNALNLL